MQKKININNKKLKTSILIKKNFISKFVINIAKKNEKVFCIIDSKIRNNLKINNQKNIIIISFKCGEKIKTFDKYKDLAEKLILKDVNRKSAVIAIGGGSLGDLVEFVCESCFSRVAGAVYADGFSCLRIG